MKNKEITETEWWQELANNLGVDVEILKEHHLPLIYFYNDGASPAETAKAFLNVRE